MTSRLSLALGVAIALAAGRATAAEPRPSVLLFVIDTLRADAVSAYGRVARTTPLIDEFAKNGLLYARAYSQAPWTLPSHTTLFTGLLPSQHEATWRTLRARDELSTLAERLRDAGYETAGFSENWLIGPASNLDQGFDRFEIVRNDARAISRAVGAWARARRRARKPFFLFINVLDPHAPYRVRARNPHLPEFADAEVAREVSQSVPDYLCARTASQFDLDVLRGLYLGEVAVADAKLGAVWRELQRTGQTRRLITVITSDHGEHFGEHGLVSHQFSVREALLRVPLVVHGLPRVKPARIDEPVQHLDLVPSVLAWAWLEPPAGLPGRPLPTPARARPRSSPSSAIRRRRECHRGPTGISRSHFGPRAECGVTASPAIRCSAPWER